MIEGFVTRERGYGRYGLHYPLDGNAASLSIEVETGDSRIGFGVKCSNKQDRKYRRLKEKLKDMGGESEEEWWPWYKYADGDIDLKDLSSRDNLRNLASLSKDETRKGFATEIACGLKQVWDKVKETA